MDQSFSPSLYLSFYLGISGALFLFLALSFKPLCSHFSLSLSLQLIWVPSKGFKWRRGGLSLQNVIPVKQGRTHARVFPLHCQLAFSYQNECLFLRSSDLWPLNSRTHLLRSYCCFWHTFSSSETYIRVSVICLICLFRSQRETVPVSEKGQA